MPQNFENHKQFSKLYHFIIFPISFIIWVYFIFKTVTEPSEMNFFVCVIFLLLLLSSAEARMSALKVQDRSIINEMRLRYFMLTNSQLPRGLKRNQIIALRFASDEELSSLIEKAVAEKLSPTAIKKSITNWNPDYGRA